MKKLGEVFEFEGIALEVKESMDGSCTGCVFYDRCVPDDLDLAMTCGSDYRTDGMDIIYTKQIEA
jgi:hypothetical protein